MDLPSLDIDALASGFGRGDFSCADLAAALVARIAALDAAGPLLRSVIAVNPEWPAGAAALDRERRSGTLRGPLHGIPVLLKDNIDTAGPLPTTAGSLFLAGAPAAADSIVSARLKAAGALVLGKANLSEWANFRSERSSSGWSAVGGQTRNPYALDRSPGGSSAGSAAAVAAGFAPASVGTETDGSIVCPAAVCGVVGLKPTVGLIPRTGIVPLAASQDTAGPLARSVLDCARVLDALAGPDPTDPATAPDSWRRRYGRWLDPAAAAALAARGMVPPAGGYAEFVLRAGAGGLNGRRVGVARQFAGFDAPTEALFAAALERLADLGAVLVDPTPAKTFPRTAERECTVLLYEFRRGIAAYLAGRQAAPAGDLAGLIAWNKVHADREMPFFGQDIFEKALATEKTGPRAYRAALADIRRRSQDQGLGRTFADQRLDFLVYPSLGPAGKIDHAVGDRWIGGETSLAAVSGWPHLTLPMGLTRDALPSGLSLIGRPGGEAALLAAAAAFEADRGPFPAPTFTVSPD